ncbi:MAG: right-handed parallel beta-helix repeat-containing protein [Lentisphaerae bacterium]|nr:right-handed parallel beta-helix repeat-containing protein [Lentisphaerota bacterium]
MKKTLWSCVACAAAVMLNGATYFVDNVKGNDRNPGTAEAPFASILRGIGKLKGGDRLEVVNSGVPYTRPYPGDNGPSYSLYITGGTPEKPTVLNGNGAVISGLSVVPADKWTKVSDRICSLPFWPMSNEYKGYKKQDYWLPELKIWFVDGKNALNALSRQEMESKPGSFYWSRKDRRVFFHLPEGKTLDQLKVQLPATSGFYICKSNIHVENFFVINSWNDGFDTAYDVKNAVYRNCIAISNCGQGFSCHEGGEVLYEDCGAFNCASSGLTNVQTTKVTFKRCVIGKNVFEAGVKVIQNAYVKMVDSLVISNRPNVQIGAYNNAVVELENCVVRGYYAEPISFLKDGKLTFDKCTIVDGSCLSIPDKRFKGVLTVKNSLLGCLRIAPVPTDKLILENSVLFKMPKAADDGGIGIDYQAMKNGETVPVIEGKGAKLSDSVWQMYNKYKNAAATPEGVDLNGRK